MRGRRRRTMRGHGPAAALALSLSAPAWALPVCERTPHVQVAITRAADADSCGAVGAAALARITRLNLDGGAWLSPIHSLKAGDFDGLASLGLN